MPILKSMIYDLYLVTITLRSTIVMELFLSHDATRVESKFSTASHKPALKILVQFYIQMHADLCYPMYTLHFWTSAF